MATLLQSNPPPTLPLDVRLMQGTATLLVALLLLGVAALVLHWAVRLPVFAIRSIGIEGDVAHNNVVTIRANALPKLAGSFFTMDLHQAQSAFESVPWVRRAVVRRAWPDRLNVRLEEFQAAALWGGSDEPEARKLVSRHGEVFEANIGDVEDDGLPTLRGPEGSASQVLAMWQRLGPVAAPMQARIEALTLSARGSWRAELDNGAVIELGRGSDDEVLARAERFVATLPQVTARYGRALEYADLRHNDGYALRLHGVATLVAPASDAKSPKH
ncbi:MAG: cell division protein FtsQ/DivIB [Burkholderiaceae bacterium]|nr:cell division protein FtsQ/DivIB [Burkholderiaceae bacterium]